MQINNAAFDNTPFLNSALPTLANFGLATSYSNCSDTSRMSLRSGARPTDFPDPEQRVLHQPTFWQFAKKAGYRTVHMDAWQSIHPMDNMQTYDELRYIDQIASVSLTPYSQADDRLAELMLAEFDKPGPSFLFVEKMGMHTPYQTNLPDAPSYQPKAGSLPHPEFTGTRAADVRDYVIGIWWRTDRFFQRVLPAVDKPGVLLIYTSDHGQSMYDGGYDATACSGTNAVKGEGVVPLFVFAGDPAVRAEFQAAAMHSFNRAAHTDIFPTLLSAMGFDPELVEPPYGGGLLNVPSERRRHFFVFSPFTPSVNWVNTE
jgi:glucan phosphoethanolaminetransferase (alkaline phosphatase superfamily)